MQLSQTVQYAESLQNFYSKHKRIFAQSQQGSSFKDYYTRFPEHIFLSIKFQLRRIYQFTFGDQSSEYKEYYEESYIYRKG